MWEVTSLSAIKNMAAKEVGELRNERAVLGQKLQTLHKLVQLIEKASKDSELLKIMDVHEKYLAACRKEESTSMKRIERERAIEEKLRVEKEKADKKE